MRPIIATACRQLPICGLILALAASPVQGADPAPAKAAPAPAKPAAKTSAKSADAKPKEGSLGKGTGELLTIDQLRRCLADQDRNKQETADLAQAQRAIEKDRADIERLGAELEADKATLDLTNEAAVNAYNERARARTRMIEAFKAAAPGFNARVDKLAADKQAFTTDCADKRYFEEDYNAILAGK